jgi:hypothetical protein
MFNLQERNVSVYNVENRGKFIKARISSSKKNKDGTYSTSFWNAIFVGQAFDTTLSNKEKIKITSATIENKEFVDKDGNKRVNAEVVIFQFERQVPKFSNEEIF